ncbi:MAG: folate-binding protein YgfZ [Methyloceanibacter sp.]|nr:folate-binding protein YgfZ [Methyloceanibacter sp.]
MSHCHVSLLASRSVLRVGGAEARKYLQGLITNDIGKAQGAVAIHAGLLSPQGKILFDFFALGAGDGFLIDVAQEKAAELLKRLVFYRLRAQVEITEEPSLAVAAAWGGTPRLPEGAMLYADPRLSELGFRILVPKGTQAAELGCAPAPGEDYHAFRISLGVPEGGLDYGFGDAFPHEALFDQLNGVDFKKGCYVGQEVVARMQFRGTARKRIVPVEGETSLPAPGAGIEADGMPIGTIGSVNGASGLALIRLDRAEEALARGKTLTTGGVKITLRRPAFARFEVPVAEVLA